MNASLRALLSGVIDYAGLFPPAKLPLDQAIRNYTRSLNGPDGWMLGRFVIPSASLGGLAAFAEELAATRLPVRFSALGGAERQFKESCGGRFGPDTVESRGPLEPQAATAAAAEWAGAGATLFYEIAGEWRKRLAEVAAALAAFNVHHPEHPAGLKLRTGGLEASAFPPVEEVAFVLNICREAGVRLKFTAGLHHPLRHFDAALQTHMHGFINVFVAGVLAHARRIDEEALRAAIADEDAAHFTFTDAGLSWKDRHASVDEIADARRDFVTSFGSCSFDEPRDDLRALGWM